MQTLVESSAQRGFIHRSRHTNKHHLRLRRLITPRLTHRHLHPRPDHLQDSAPLGNFGQIDHPFSAKNGRRQVENGAPKRIERKRTVTDVVPRGELGAVVMAVVFAMIICRMIMRFALIGDGNNVQRCALLKAAYIQHERQRYITIGRRQDARLRLIRRTHSSMLASCSGGTKSTLLSTTISAALICSTISDS